MTTPRRSSVVYLSIRKGVPIPPPARVGRGKFRYPWDDMKVGDSFLVPGDARVATLYSAAYRVTDRLGWFFTVRQVKGGVRVWRTA